MSDENSKLLESLMGALGDNPSEKLGQILSGLSEKSQGDTGAEGQNSQKSDSMPDLDMMMKLGSMMGKLGNSSADERSALLSALKPFMSEERRPQIDQAIKLLRLSQLAKTAKDLDLLNNLL